MDMNRMDVRRPLPQHQRGLHPPLHQQRYWRLVRYSPDQAAWHPAGDNLRFCLECLALCLIMGFHPSNIIIGLPQYAAMRMFLSLAGCLMN